MTTTTQRVALIFGAVYLLVGLLGFLPFLRSPPIGDPGLAIEASHGRLLGLFPINLMHNLVHIAIGIWGLMGARSLRGAVTFCKGTAVLYAALTILGLFPVTYTLFGLAPIHSHDVWLHALTALVLGYFGFVHDRNRTAAVP